MDTKPRKMTTEDYRVLNSCAEMVRCLPDPHSWLVLLRDRFACQGGTAQSTCLITPCMPAGRQDAPYCATHMRCLQDLTRCWGETAGRPEAHD